MEEKTIPLAELPKYLLVPKEDWEKTEKTILSLPKLQRMLRKRYEKLKSKYEELEFKYDLQKSENVRLAYINKRIGIIAKEKCPEIAAFLERMKLMREQSIKDMTERAKGENESITH